MYPNYEEVVNYLRKVDIHKLQEKISNFRKLDIKNISEVDLFQNIYKVLCEGNLGFKYIPNIGKYNINKVFYRARILGDIDDLENVMQTKQDFWSPPEKFVKNYGRLNKPGESLLYTAPNPITCVNELKIEPEQVFVLIKYKAIDKIKANIICGDYDYDGMNIKDEKAKFVNEMLNNFLKEEYSREVGIGTEHLYRTSEMIAKNFFDLPPMVFQDAWAYVSTFDKKSYNVCFRPDIAQMKLMLDGAVIAKTDEIKTIKSLCFTPGYDERYQRTYFYEMCEEYYRHMFPFINN